MPPMHPFCRCTVVPVVDSALGGLTDEEKRAWVADGAPEGVQGWLKKSKKDGILISQGSDGMSIHKPIEQRNTAKGNPNAILTYDRPLNNRQQKLLDELPTCDSRAIVRKGDVNMRDLSALTATTGDEFALFTKGGERLVIRGDTEHVSVTVELAQTLAKNGYRWSGHTHPGVDDFSLYCSDGDKMILRCFTNQAESGIWNSLGHNEHFGKD